MNQFVFAVRGLGSIKPPKKKKRDAKEIYHDKRTHSKITLRPKTETELAELPKSPDCLSFITWYLQTNYELAAIPPLFFHRILLLQVLDLSGTNIKSLPKSLPKSVALKKLCLRQCKLFMELSPQVGKLKNLEELDLEETQIMDLPAEIGELVKLKQLRVSFYGHANCSKKRLLSNIVVRPGTISNLSQLIELSIDVDPADKRWGDSVEAVVKEVCRLKALKSLRLYLPKVQLLDDCRSDSKSLMYPSLSGFRFVVGYQKRRSISRVPDQVEAQFRNWEKCLKFVNGGNIPIEIRRVLNYSTSFFLDHHATALNLSEFGIENMKRLEFCLLAECNKMETIIDGEMHYEGNENIDQSEVHPSSAKHVLESLKYLSIYYLENLGSIWKGPVQYGCFSKLKFIAFHTCPQLSAIFPHALLENFVNLEEIILEDCPRVTSLISQASICTMSDNSLPRLKRLLLLHLPELVSISNGLPIAPKLESISFYSCPKFKSISKMELSSTNLKMIKGDSQWWADIKWNETEWGTGADYLMRIFSPISKDRDVMTQLTEDPDIFEASIKREEQPGKVIMTKFEPQDHKISDSAPISKDRDVMTQLVEDPDIFEASIKREEQPGKVVMTKSEPQDYKISDSAPIDGDCSPYSKMGTGQLPELFASDHKRENRNDNVKRKLRERRRRQEFKSLISSLKSLLPLDTKRKCTIQDILERAQSYILLLRNRMIELCASRDELKKLQSSFDSKMSSNDYSSSCVVEVRSCSDVVNVMLRSSVRGQAFTLSRVLELLLEEGLEVFSYTASTVDGRSIHTIQSKVGYYVKCFDISVLQQKLAAEVS